MREGLLPVCAVPRVAVRGLLFVELCRVVVFVPRRVVRDRLCVSVVLRVLLVRGVFFGCDVFI